MFLFVFHTVLNNSNGIMWNLDSSPLTSLSAKSDQHQFLFKQYQYIIRISEYHHIKGKCVELSLENLFVNIGAQRVI